MKGLDIEIEQGRSAFGPGDEIAGKAKWQMDDSPESLELSLFWRTEGKGTQDVGIAETIKIHNPGALGEKEFRLTVPKGPYSFSGKLISIIWALELSGPRGKDVVRKEIVISPTGKEIVCTQGVSDSDEDKARGILPGLLRKLKSGGT
ncbi:MAG: hypothetical protein ACYTEL_26935 [Planctomycetota bacterium]|jgi:hypothetical protein